MKNMIKKINSIILIGVLVFNVLNINVYAGSNNVSVSKSTVDIGDGRSFEVTYTVNVTAEAATPSDVILVIDRSNSMLYYVDEDDTSAYNYADDAVSSNSWEWVDELSLDDLEPSDEYDSGYTYLGYEAIAYTTTESSSSYYGSNRRQGGGSHYNNNYNNYYYYYYNDYSDSDTTSQTVTYYKAYVSKARVVDQVKNAMIEFIEEVFAVEGNQLAIVAYGNEGIQSNNGNYYSSSQSEAAIAEVERLLAYSSTSYSINQSESSQYDGAFWVNEKTMIGSTNIKAGLEEAQEIVGNESANSDKSVVLFTDGYATAGVYTYETTSQPVYEYYGYWYNESNAISDAEYYEIENYEVIEEDEGFFIGYYYIKVDTGRTISYTSDTGNDYAKAAEEQADDLDAIANTTIYTLGYTGALGNYATTAMATLSDIASSADMSYESPTSDELDAMMEGISSSINSVGSDARVFDALADGFVIDPDSITPSQGTATTNDDYSELTWDIGALGAGTHTLTMTITVPNDSYPTGRKNVVTSESCYISFNDLDSTGTSDDPDHTKDFNVNSVDISSLNNAPAATLAIEHVNASNGGYLVGDTVLINHTLTYTNPEGLDFVQIDVGDFEKELVSGPGLLAEGFTFVGDDSWTVSGESLTVSFDETSADSDPTALSWTATSALELEGIMAGEYTFNHSLGYTLSNDYGDSFDFDHGGFDPDVINVKEGSITVVLYDNYGLEVDGAKLYINDVEQINASLISGTYTIEGITTGDYTVEVAYPSGFEAPDGYTINDENNIELSYAVDYANNAESKSIELNRLTIQNLAVTTIEGESSTTIAAVTDTVSAIVDFKTLSDMEQLSLNVADDFAGEDMTFTLTEVVDSAGVAVSGFSLSGTTITYDESTTVLPIGEYSAYIVVTPPTTIIDGDSFDVAVNEVTIDSMAVTTTCQELTITYDASSGGEGGGATPESPSPGTGETTTTLEISLIANIMNTTHTRVDVSISSDDTIVAYKCLPGTLTADDFASYANGYGLNSVDAADANEVTAQFDIYFSGTEDQEDGMFVDSGTYTVYSENASGKVVIETIEIEEPIDTDDADFSLM